MLTSEKPALHLLVPPSVQGVAAQHGLIPAHLAYRVGSGPHLFRTQLPAALKGGIMVLEHRGFDGAGQAETFCQEVIRECAVRSFQGLFCDFDIPAVIPVLERAVTLLAPAFQKRSWSLYVPQGYAANAPGAKVVVPTALSGGSLRHHLREAIDAYGLERVALGLQWSCEDFSLPAREGSGVPLSWNELKVLRQRRRPNVYFSNDLCAHYFTYMPTGESPHFVLFDDAESMAKKLDLAREMGIREAFLPYPEPPELLPALLSGKGKETP